MQQKVAKQVGKRMRWSDAELSLIKNTFAEQEEILILVRKFLLQGEFAKDELAYLKSFTSNADILAILKKAINPQLDKQAAPFQSVDLFSSMDFNPTPAEHANLIILARAKACQFLKERFEAFEGKETEGINFDEMIIPNDDYEQTYINMICRNFLLSHIDSQLFNSIAVIAGTKEETLDQQKRRLTLDSNK